MVHVLVHNTENMMGNSEMYKVLRKGADHPNRWTMDSLKLLLTSSWMDNYKGILICDVDGTLRNGSHRLHLLPSQEEIAAAGDTPNIAFTRFNEGCSGDEPIKPVIDLVKMYHTQGYYVIILTSCTCSQNTLNTLLNQLEVWDVPYHAAVMRGKDNHRWPVEYKEQFLYDSGIVTSTVESVVALDDCMDNCNMFREYDILALQVESHSRFNKGDTK